MPRVRWGASPLCLPDCHAMCRSSDCQARVAVSWVSHWAPSPRVYGCAASARLQWPSVLPGGTVQCRGCTEPAAPSTHHTRWFSQPVSRRASVNTAQWGRLGSRTSWSRFSVSCNLGALWSCRTICTPTREAALTRAGFICPLAAPIPPLMVAGRSWIPPQEPHSPQEPRKA